VKGALSARPYAGRPVVSLTRGRFLALACAIVAIGLLGRIAAGALKTDYHVDEGITLALTNGSWKPPVVEPIFDRWLSKAELENLAFNSNLIASGRPDFGGISRATGADVHPPLYYWLFAVARVVVGPARHMAACLLLNGACFVATAACLALMILRANRGGPGRGRAIALVSLALFAAAPASVALTSFMRMYELSQLACAALTCLAAFIAFPGSDGAYGPARPLAIAGLSAVFFAGVMTHYHFLFFALSLCLVAVILLLARGEIPTLLWCVLSVGIGLWAADAAFPELRLHLVYSTRSHEGIDLASRIFGGEIGAFLSRAALFFRMVLRHVPAVAASIAVCGFAAAHRLVRARDSRVAVADSDLAQSAIPGSFIILLAVPCAVALIAVASTVPFASLRYIAPFIPVGIVPLVCAALGGDRSFSARARFLAMAAVASAALCALPGGLPAFHDEYPADRSPEYFRDGTPVIVVSNRQGFEWKNLLAYLVIPDNKRVFVTMRYDGGDIARSLEGALEDAGTEEAYVMIDALFPAQDGMERIGFYGFFSVYRVVK